ncbi:VOC family protein [Agrococcus sp. HG114]|uniref:VOC family protein n=1 Tax=Agrococcus sp. HG114 TaxID=2969757 RepID=UPI00215B2F21|nr:VOC family protein [Agrococcus sp. HG114]MCR8670602.1 VOC family protein [Agrococcus sp. HG114]
MTAMTNYIWFPGSAREALSSYHRVFGGELELHTLADMGRDDGPADAIGHGVLDGPVTLFGADAVGDDEPVRMTGISLALLGTAEPDTLARWFAALSEGGTVLDPLQERPWGASDGQVVDRFGIRWLIGFEHEAAAAG